jgi:GNAT superfamily N-acetyltransferase
MQQEFLIRPGTEEDAYACFVIYEVLIHELYRRVGKPGLGEKPDEVKLQRIWHRRASLYHLLQKISDQFWVAEQDDTVIGLARSIVNGDIRQLTEFFVLPEVHSRGVGKNLLGKALPAEENQKLSIIATQDINAQSLYIKSGAYPKFPICYFGRKPRISQMTGQLTFVDFSSEKDLQSCLRAVDQKIIGFQRDEIHAWLQMDRTGTLVYRGNSLAGYAYFGEDNGPIALLNEDDFPEVIAYGENYSAEVGFAEFGLEVPMANMAAVKMLLSSGYRMDTLIMLWMNNVPFGRFSNYIVASPSYFL